MDAIMLHYYQFKSIVSKLPNFIKENIKDFADDDFLFNVASFNDCPLFYRLFNLFKKDKYGLYEKFKSNEMNNLIADCIIKLHDDNDYKKLIFIYALYTHKLLDEYLNEYLNGLNIKENVDDLLNIIDYFMTKENDNIDITKTALSKAFKKGFVYYSFINETLNTYIVKNFDLYISNEYLEKCYRKKYLFYRFFNRSKTKIKMLPYKIIDKIFKKRTKKCSSYLINKKTNITRLLNKDKESYNFFEKKVDYDFYTLLAEFQKKALKDIEIINDYLFYDKEKEFRHLFKLNKEKKL